MSGTATRGMVVGSGTALARRVGEDERPYVIAEIGVNHDGLVERALDLVRAAARAGADAVKFQYFRADLLVPRISAEDGGGLARYQARAGERDARAMLRRLELPMDALAACVLSAHRSGLHAIVTVFNLELVARAAVLPWDAFKTASPDIVHRPLLEALARQGRPLIISTGASTASEVRRGLLWARSACGDGSRLAALQCVSSYPAPAHAAGLEGVPAVARIVAEVGAGAAGYSDHTQGVWAGAAAVAFGASILEKHLTHDRSAIGPDHAASLTPEEFATYVAMTRAAHAKRRAAGRTERATGVDGQKVVLPIEREVRGLARQSIVAARGLRAGQVIAAEDLAFRRPGTGLEPWMAEIVIGRVVGRDVPAGSMLTMDDLAWASPVAARAAA